MRVEEYSSQDAIGLAEMVRKRQVSPQEVAEAALTAVERLNPAINATYLIDMVRARDMADKVDRSAPLAGVPFLIKDVNVFVPGWPTTFASRFFKGARHGGESEIVARWRRAGLVFLGKSNTPEFAEDYVTETSWRGTTYNPWNKGVTVGGSSGGAAAAVASGMVPVAHGSDSGGSIRIPAACCGLFGLKPSRGLNPLGPYYGELAGGLNCDHVLSRSVRDSAALLDATAGPELGGPYLVRRSVTSYLAALDHPIAPMKIAMVTQAPAGAAVDPEIVTAVERAAHELEALGHQIQPHCFPSALDNDAGSLPLWMLDVAVEINRRMLELGRGPIADELEAASWAIFQRVQRLTALDIAAARQRAHDTSVAVARHFADFDLILTPALATLPPPLGVIDSRSAKFDFDGWLKAGMAFAPFSEVFNVTGQPAASLPMFHARNGLPIGIQLAARPGEDHQLLRVAAQVEAVNGWGDRHPPIWAGSSG